MAQVPVGMRVAVVALMGFLCSSVKVVAYAISVAPRGGVRNGKTSPIHGLLSRGA